MYAVASFPADALAKIRASSESRPGRAPYPLRFWHLGSFDAPTVAIVWTWGFAWPAHVQLPVWVYVLIALVVWAVYVADRLLDARTGLRNPEHHTLQERHLFHWRHRRVLLPLALAASAAACWLMFSRLPLAALRSDSVLAAAALAYFSGVHVRVEWPKLARFVSRFVSRESLVGTLFTAGCFMPVIWLHPGPRSLPASLWPLLPVVAAFAVLASLNVYAIGRWESERNDSRLFKLASALACAAVTGAIVLAHFAPRSAMLLVSSAVSASLLILLDHFRTRLAPVTLRAFADLVLLVPAFTIPITALLR